MRSRIFGLSSCTAALLLLTMTTRTHASSLLLTREDSASQQLGLAMAARTWRVIASAEKEALSNQSIARLLHRVAFVNSTLVRESLLAVAQWHRKCLPQPYKDSVDSLVKGWGQRCVTENGFNRCKDHQRNNKNLRMARAARRHYLKDSKVFENVYKRKEIVAEPTNFGGKGRPRLNKALYEYQSGEPSVPDEMLSAITGNASWQSPGPQSAHLIPLAFRLLLHCVEGFDSPNWRVENDGWRSAFSGGRLGGGENQHKHVSRDSDCSRIMELGRGNFKRKCSTACHFDATMFSGQRVCLAPWFLFRRCSLLGDRAVWSERFAPQISCEKQVSVGRASGAQQHSENDPQAAAHNAFLGVTDHRLTKLDHALDVDFSMCKTVMSKVEALVRAILPSLSDTEIAAILSQRQNSQGHRV